MRPRPQLGHVLSELRDQLARFTARCRAMRWLGPLFHTRVQADILAEAEQARGAIAQTAYAAEQHDLEAGTILREVLADGKVTRRELPRMRRALRLVTRSAQQDREISDNVNAA